MKYASVMESPPKMHFWSGVGAVAGALRRKVWIDMARFQWTPSFYVIYVAKPGIVAKSTTVDVGMSILRQIPGIKFGPDAVTWQSLVKSFAEASEAFEYDDAWHPMSPITLEASELSNLINIQDREMLSLLITLWDGRKRYDKQTKMSGNDTVEAPWINLQACTTPDWLASNIPPSMVGGGLSSRCIFVFADKKHRYVPLVDEVVGTGDKRLQADLISDLLQISTELTGPFRISKEAREWEHARYETYWKAIEELADDKMVEGYAARKQTHLFKLAMVVSVSEGNTLTIEKSHLERAHSMLLDIERDLPVIFAQIGKSEAAQSVDRLMLYLKKKKEARYEDAYLAIHTAFPDYRDFAGIIAGLIASGQVKQGARSDGKIWISLS